MTMVIPADGPSFGIPIMVARTAMSKFVCQSFGSPTSFAWVLMNWAAAATLSFMTLCIEPRLMILPRTLRGLHLEVQQTTTIVADHRQTDDFADSWCAGQRDLLLPLGIKKPRRDALARLREASAELNRPVFPRCHEMELIADSLATFDPHGEQLAELIVRHFAVWVHELQ